jgi:serine protease
MPDADSAVGALKTLNGVANAYVDVPAEEPTVYPGNDCRWPRQGYLDPAPDGIDAEFGWQFDGGDGAGQHFIDLERGWTLEHEDLKDHGATLVGAIFDNARPHGTKVLGVVCAVDNDRGDVGIAPNVDSVGVVSYYQGTRADAIVAAIDRLPYGGILLLEAQLRGMTIGGTYYWGLPIEVLDADFEAIRLATAYGITVVEAGGNSRIDLDTVKDDYGNLVLNRGDRAFCESGAIMVGAATSTVPHSPVYFSGNNGSNYGSRIDCFAWGEDVDTPTSTITPPFSTTEYTGSFCLTSSASAIVAGAALVAQGIAESVGGYRLSAFEMHNLLANPAMGTPSKEPSADRIGVMPDLRKIIKSNAIGAAPAVYGRDFAGDTGERGTRGVFVSPDIVTSTVAEKDPQEAFGDGSGIENRHMSGLIPGTEPSQDTYIYVRLRNRGGSAATEVKADVYWAPVASLVTPDLWAPVGSVIIPSVPSGDVPTVSEPVAWTANALPVTGGCCLVVLFGSASDPTPYVSDLADWDNFLRLVGDNSHAIWRNFNVIDIEPQPSADPGDYVTMPFLAPGAPDRGRRMRLEVVSRLPEGSRLFLEMPSAMYESLCKRVLPAENVGREEGLHHAVRVPMNPHGARSLGAMLFPAKSRAELRLLAQVPAESRKMSYEVSVRQIYEDTVVGRTTWRLTPMDEGASREDYAR